MNREKAVTIRADKSEMQMQRQFSVSTRGFWRERRLDVLTVCISAASSSRIRAEEALLAADGGKEDDQTRVRWRRLPSLW